jgi:1-deoxy-D-xylulose-5-phosphate synthase
MTTREFERFDNLKQLEQSELSEFCGVVRDFLIDHISRTGGHFAPNLGVVELTVALHYLFDSPRDKFVFDVSHQSYVHQMLTGRASEIVTPKNGVATSHYSQANDPHDLFHGGLTSSSISLALGLAAARPLDDLHHVVAIIGDGALGGGLAFEGLNNVVSTLALCGRDSANFIIIVNDNEYSISKNVGGLHAHLGELRESNGKCENNIFKSLGLDYIYESEGNDIVAVLKALGCAKECDNPVVLHLHTQKGSGVSYAVEDTPRWHFSPTGFDKETGEAMPTSNRHCVKQLVATRQSTPNSETPTPPINYAAVGNRVIGAKLDKNPNSRIVMPGNPILGRNFAAEHPNQYIDVSIAEAHAISFASGLGRGYQVSGAQGRIYVVLEGCFMQRAYSQMLTDLFLNGSPVTVVIQGTGIQETDAVHAGQFDISLLQHIPGIVYLAPSSPFEYAQMLEWADDYSGPVLIRVSRGVSCIPSASDRETPPFVLGESEIITTGQNTQVALFGLGLLFDLAAAVAEDLEAQGIAVTLINPRSISHLDLDLLGELKKNHKIIVTLENGILKGGFGQNVSMHMLNSDVKVLNFGAENEFTDWEPIESQYKRYGLTVENIVEEVKQILA